MKEVFSDNWVSVFCGDSQEVLAGFPDASVDLIVTDPPYGTITEKIGKGLPEQEIYSHMERVSISGGFIFVFSAARADLLSEGVQRLTAAGLRTNFTPIFWCYAKGLPKAMPIGRAIDKKMGARREVVGFVNPYPDGRARYKAGHKGKVFGESKSTQTSEDGKFPVTAPSSPEAQLLEGSYAGYQPKPNVEVILVGMKKLSECNFIAQAMKDGKGITWLDDGRIPWPSDAEMKLAMKKANTFQSIDFFGKPGNFPEYTAQAKGRFAPNLLIQDQILDDGEVHGAGSVADGHIREAGTKECGFNPIAPREKLEMSSQGLFSTLFDLDRWFAVNCEKRLPESVARNFPALIVKKPQGSEANFVEGKHPTMKPIKLMCYLISIGSREEDLVLDPFLGSGSSMIAARTLGRKFIGIDISEEFCDLAVRRYRAIWEGE
jgi:site-specific DNA-methyltransferase (adenine-specific)